MLSKYSTAGKIVFFVILIAVFAAFLLLFNNTPVSPQANDTEATEEGINKIVEANNKFALDIYSQINTEGKNIFFSPYSISTALSMTYEGARGNTAQEMSDTLYIPAEDEVRRPAVAAVYNHLNKEEALYKLHTANAIWPQKDYNILEEYKGIVKDYYVGKATNLDFKNQTEQSRQTINSWVEDKTNNKIKNLFAKGSLTSATRLVLTNAIYFKGDWAQQFDKKNTKEESFTVSEGNTVEVPMMSKTGDEAEFDYTETKNLQVLELPYEEEELSMTIFLPKENNLSYLEENLNLENIKEWKDNLRERRVDVYLPKFTLNTKYNLNDSLKKLGMPSAFSANADFSGMTGSKDLFISLVVHQAFIDVNEEGTEAAAATGVVMKETAAPINIPVFKADHPFIFMIQDAKNQEILFMGKIVNPASEQ